MTDQASTSEEHDVAELLHLPDPNLVVPPYSQVEARVGSAHGISPMAALVALTLFIVVATALSLLRGAPAGRDVLAPSPSTLPTATPRPSLKALVRAEAASLNFQPLVPGYLPDGLTSVSTRSGGRDPSRGGEARLLQIELSDQTGSVVAVILEGPAGCCLDYARPNATPNASIGARPIGHLIDGIAPAQGGPIIWWVEGNTYIAVSSPGLASSELLRIAASIQPLP